MSRPFDRARTLVIGGRVAVNPGRGHGECGAAEPAPDAALRAERIRIAELEARIAALEAERDLSLEDVAPRLSAFARKRPLPDALRVQAAWTSAEARLEVLRRRDQLAFRPAGLAARRALT